MTEKLLRFPRESCDAGAMSRAFLAQRHLEAAIIMLKQSGFRYDEEYYDGESAQVMDIYGKLRACVYWGTYPHGHFREIGTCLEVKPHIIKKVRK